MTGQTTVDGASGEQRGVVEGRVLDGSGAPVPGATVAVTAASRPTRDIAALTDADGRFRLGGLLPGTYRLEASLAPRTGAGEVRVDGGAPSIAEIRLGAVEEGST